MSHGATPPVMRPAAKMISAAEAASSPAFCRLVGVAVTPAIIDPKVAAFAPAQWL